MNEMQTPTMNSTPSTPLDIVSTEQIQKYLDENKVLIIAIVENQNMGKMAEGAHTYNRYSLAFASIKCPCRFLPVQSLHKEIVPCCKRQASIAQQQPRGPVAKLPFQLNALRPQDEQNQLFLFREQQQLQSQFGPRGVTGSGLHLYMQPGLGSSCNVMDLRGSQQGKLDPSSGDGLGSSGLGLHLEGENDIQITRLVFSCRWPQAVSNLT
ncbi:UNVERIFIED_CONTAM: G-interacting factor 2 [Sesamum latifolium]|uniref:G-interacting factor 2 n=1 Tax=Sesamum latifolium TaxID=2727402 RepID=A0AAW2T7L6_9LAMI